MIVGNLIGRREISKELHILFAQTNLSWRCHLGKLRRETCIKRRNAESVLIDILSFAKSRQRFICDHSTADRVEIGSNVLEPGIIHTRSDQRLDSFDACYKFLHGQSEFLRTR